MRSSTLALCFAPLAIFIVAAASSGSISFTASQMQKGERQFNQTCAQCHGQALEGGAGPPLTGPNFKTLSTKVGAHVGDVFTYMSMNMPMNAPASLTHEQYVNIMAYILSKNGYKPGSAALTYKQALASGAAIIK